LNQSSIIEESRNSISWDVNFIQKNCLSPDLKKPIENFEINEIKEEFTETKTSNLTIPTRKSILDKFEKIRNKNKIQPILSPPRADPWLVEEQG